MTHGFPKVPSPVFKSSLFPIENRPGLEDASTNVLFDHLLRNGDMLALQFSHSNAENAGKRELAIRGLSDWHLVSFVGTLGLLSEVSFLHDSFFLCLKTLAKDDLRALLGTATASRNDAPAAFDNLMSRAGWQNILLIARESIISGEFIVSKRTKFMRFLDSGASDSTRQGEPPTEISAIETDDGPRIHICPHCTYENTHGGSDCDVCGLPLNQL